jgi:hypothetical protein
MRFNPFVRNEAGLAAHSRFKPGRRYMMFGAAGPREAENDGLTVEQIEERAAEKKRIREELRYKHREEQKEYRERLKAYAAKQDVPLEEALRMRRYTEDEE